jgi:hypothetical protein
MKKKLFTILQYIIFLGGGIFLVWWQLKSMTAKEKEDFYHALTYANYWLILPVVIMSLLSHLSRAMRWKLLMEPLGYRPALKNVFAVTMVGYLANAAVPRLGEVLRCTFLARYEGLKVDKLFGTILVERTFDFMCYLIFIGLTVLIQIDLIGEYVQSKLQTIAHGDIPLWARLLVIGAVIFTVVAIIRFLFRRFPSNGIIIRIKSFIQGIGAGFKTIKQMKRRKLFIAHTVFIWTMYLLQIYIGFSAMDGTSHLGIKAACSVLTLATLAMIATPGGIGSFPIFVMETLLIYNITKPLGEAFGWLLWGVSTSIIIVAGLIALILLPLINKRKYEVSSGDPI